MGMLPKLDAKSFYRDPLVRNNPKAARSSFAGPEAWRCGFLQGAKCGVEDAKVSLSGTHFTRLRIMNKAFTKEDSSNEPVIVPERAPLPPGVPNYVTERGMRLLEEERRQLVADRARLGAMNSESDAEERRQQLVAVNKRLRDLTERIATARTVASRPRADRTVRFGATVTLKSLDDEGSRPLRIKLVGVDEAGERPDFVAFCAPIATAMLGRQPGDQVTRRTSTGEEALEIIEVEYEDSPAS